jgi:hypothetical protein
MGGIMEELLQEIAAAVEDGYQEGIDWKLQIDKPTFREDIADLILQGYTIGHLPCNWKLEFKTDLGY